MSAMVQCTRQHVPHIAHSSHFHSSHYHFTQGRTNFLTVDTSNIHVICNVLCLKHFFALVVCALEWRVAQVAALSNVRPDISSKSRVFFYAILGFGGEYDNKAGMWRLAQDQDTCTW
jgi:hypothetical protein